MLCSTSMHSLCSFITKLDCSVPNGYRMKGETLMCELNEKRAALTGLMKHTQLRRQNLNPDFHEVLMLLPPDYQKMIQEEGFETTLKEAYNSWLHQLSDERTGGQNEAFQTLIAYGIGGELHERMLSLQYLYMSLANIEKKRIN